MLSDGNLSENSDISAMPIHEYIFMFYPQQDIGIESIHDIMKQRFKGEEHAK